MKSIWTCWYYTCNLNVSLELFHNKNLRKNQLHTHFKVLHKGVGCLLNQTQFSSVTQSCPTLCNPMNRSMPGLPVHHQSRSLPKLMFIESVMPSSHLILCHPLFLLPSIFPSIRVFSNESTLYIR